MPFLAAQSLSQYGAYETTKSLTNLSQNSCMWFMTMPDDTLNSSPEYLQSVKRQREKWNVLNEILTSEKKYMSDIREIVEGYYDEISKTYEENNEFIYHIFSNITEIFDFTKSFYLMLEQASTKDEMAVATCFIRKYKNFSKLYSIYCQNYKIAHSTTERLEKDSTIGKIIQRVRNKYGHSLKMATYLQLPVLRITKYHLLLQRYLKVQDKDSVAYRYVLEALELMRQVNDQINRDMPEFSKADSVQESGSCSNNLTTLNLTALFGSVLKQGQLVLTDSGHGHHIVVFQTMFLIRETDATSKIINTITNDCLGFSPVTQNSGYKNWKKCFSVIDYNQNKSESICQYTFRTVSSEEKKSWQSAILSCMLNGYGKKISENVKKKVMKIDEEAYAPKYESIRTKITNFKRIKDLKNHSNAKNDFRNSSCHNFDYHDLDTTNPRDTVDPNMTAPPMYLNADLSSNTKRRITEPFKSPLTSMLSRKTPQNELNTTRKSLEGQTTKSENALQHVLRKFYRNGKLNKKKLNFNETSFASESMLMEDSLNRTCVEGTKFKHSNHTHNKTSVEIKLNDFEIIYQHLDNTYKLVESSNLLHDTTVSKFEKFINKKIATSKMVENKIPPIERGESVLTEIEKNSEIYESSLSSKSSINSEEGYYSNHESSVSTLINEMQPDENLREYHLTKHSLANDTQLISTPNLIRKHHASNDTDSSSGHSEQSSSSGSNTNIIHIEIINNFESMSNFDTEPHGLFTNSVTENSVKALEENKANQKRSTSMRFKENQVTLNSGNFETASFNQMQQLRYQKKLSNCQMAKQKLGPDNYRMDSMTCDTIPCLSSVKLNRPHLKYQRFSRNLNSSICCLQENVQRTNQTYTTPSEDLDTSHSLLNNSSLNNFSYNATSQLLENPTSIKSAEQVDGSYKCKSLSDLQVKVAATTSESPPDNKLNVKDLISKFENR